MSENKKENGLVMKIVKMPANGRVTIPKVLRKKLKLKPGTKVSFIEKDGFVFIQPLNRKYFNDVAGVLGMKGKHLRSLMEEKMRRRN